MLRGNDYLSGIKCWTRNFELINQYYEFRKKGNFCLLELSSNKNGNLIWNLNLINLLKLFNHPDDQHSSKKVDKEKI